MRREEINAGGMRGSAAGVPVVAGGRSLTVPGCSSTSSSHGTGRTPGGRRCGFVGLGLSGGDDATLNPAWLDVADVV